jgi:hypothetical protein
MGSFTIQRGTPCTSRQWSLIPTIPVTDGLAEPIERSDSTNRITSSCSISSAFTRGIRDRWHRDADVVESVNALVSHDHDLMQLADVLMGAVGFHWNHRKRLKHTAPHKVDLAAYIAHRKLAFAASIRARAHDVRILASGSSALYRSGFARRCRVPAAWSGRLKRANPDWRLASRLAIESGALMESRSSGA